MRMKLGILTFHNTLNPGATLQAYALCRYIRDQGYACEIVDYRCPNIVRRELSFHFTTNILKTVGSFVLYWPQQKQKIRESLAFLKNEGMLSPRFYDPQTISTADEVYDVFIAGADQIWNLKITEGDCSYFLPFAEKGHKFAYGSSVGDDWPSELYLMIKEKLADFDALGVREWVTKELLQNEFGLESELVADPTMLLTPDEWSEFAAIPKETGYIVLYMSEEKTKIFAREYAARHHKKIIFLGNCGYSPKRSGHRSVTVHEWVGYFQNADAVFTDSYHGLLFSMYFGKKVWTCYGERRGERQRTLLNVIDAESCRINGMEQTDHYMDIAQRTQRLDKYRERSQVWLCNILAGYEANG